MTATEALPRGNLGLDRRAEGLARAVQAARGRLDPAAVAAAGDVLERVQQRHGLGLDLTVVALVGPTGAGKSSLFNALVGDPVATVGVRRPTTAYPQAALWCPPESAAPLLGWLGIDRWHLVDPGPGAADAARGMAGLVLVDLPDLDSTHDEHRRVVDRLVQRVDLMVWVVDPQKYADRTVHEDYLAAFTRHGEVTVVVLNQVDRLDDAATSACAADLRRLLVADGLPGAAVRTVSVATGTGVSGVRQLVAAAVAARTAAATRLGADLATAADGLRAAAGDPAGLPEPVPPTASAALAEALAEAAGARLVGDAVRRSVARQGRMVTGWAPLSWTHALRSDPLSRLGLGRSGVDPALVRTSLPSSSPASTARAASAARAYAEQASEGAPPAWVRSARTVALRSVAGLGPLLDAAVAAAQVTDPRPPRWWSSARALQWALLACGVLGALWLLGLAALRALALAVPQPPAVGGLPVPTVMLVAGLLCGALLGALSSPMVAASGRRAGARAHRAVAERVAEVARIHIEEPVTVELATLADFRIGLVAAQGG